MFTGSLSRASGENVGTYTITLGTLSAGFNYTILFAGANFIITPRDLTVTADPKSKTYCNTDPALTYTHGTLYNGDTNSVFTGSLSLLLVRMQGRTRLLRVHFQLAPTTRYCLREQTSPSTKRI